MTKLYWVETHRYVGQELQQMTRMLIYLLIRPIVVCTLSKCLESSLGLSESYCGVKVISVVGMTSASCSFYPIRLIHEARTSTSKIAVLFRENALRMLLRSAFRAPVT